MTRLLGLRIGGSRGAWEQFGFTFADATSLLGDVAFVVDETGSGILDWTVGAMTDSVTAIDGIPTFLSSSAVPAGGSNAIGPTVGVALDHVVVNTDDGVRTSAAVEEVLGLPLKRVRDAGRGVEQRFHTFDNSVIEIVSGPHVTEPGAHLWGMVVSVEDIDALFRHVGPDVMSPPKPAVQEGRLISTVRASAGLGVPFAVMTPHVRAAHAG